MRKYLGDYENQKIKVKGIFEKKVNMIIKNKPEVMYVFKNLETMEGDFLTKHIWVISTKKMRRIKIKDGQQMSFNGVVKKYVKLDEKSKYGNHKVKYKSWDYGITEITEPQKYIEEGKI